MKCYDSLIVGGGPAGLSVALCLGRVSRSCVVFSHQHFRNDGVEASHSILGHDHVHPQQILAQAKKQIERYQNADFAQAEITNVKRQPTDHSGSTALPSTTERQVFVATDRSGRQWMGRTLVMATGVKDVFPDLPGYRENWPRNIHHCLFCDGWERRNTTKGILCYPSFSVSHAKLATMAHHQDSAPTPDGRSKVTVFTNGDPNPGKDEDVKKALEVCRANKIQLDTRKLTKLEDAEPERKGMYVHLRREGNDESEEKMHVGFLVHKPSTTPVASHLIEQLGLELSPGAYGDMIKSTVPFQTTNVPGVFTAGDTGVSMTHITVAMSSGTAAAAGIAHFCNEWDDERALLEYMSRSKAEHVTEVVHSEGQDGTGCSTNKVEC